MKDKTYKITVESLLGDEPEFAIETNIDREEMESPDKAYSFFQGILSYIDDK